VSAAGPVLVVKRGSATEAFAGPWRRKALTAWVFGRASHVVIATS
jgi:hypothetical protein